MLEREYGHCVKFVSTEEKPALISARKWNKKKRDRQRRYKRIMTKLFQIDLARISLRKYR